MSEQQAKPRVLVADDERVIADTLAIILNQAGFDATAVYSGEKAVEIPLIRPEQQAQKVTEFAPEVVPSKASSGDR